MVAWNCPSVTLCIHCLSCWFNALWLVYLHLFKYVFLWEYYYWFTRFWVTSSFSSMQVGCQTRDGYTWIGDSSVHVTLQSAKWIVTCEISGPCDGVDEEPSLLGHYTIDWYIVSNCLKDYTTFIFRVKQVKNRNQISWTAWRWRYYDSLKCWWLFAIWCDITSQKIWTSKSVTIHCFNGESRAWGWTCNVNYSPMVCTGCYH